LEGRDVLAERRARRAELIDPALARRAEVAEATVSTLETHLANLRRRQLEAEREREVAAARLAERELELRRVKQREHAEQQLRVEAEEATVRLRRRHRVELDRLQRRAEEAGAAAQHAEEQRAALASRLAAVSESCLRLERGIAALQDVAAELRTTFERDHRAARARIAELERELAAGAQPANSEDPVRREEMAGALAAAVERLRARAAPAPVPETEVPTSAVAGALASEHPCAPASEAAAAPTAEAPHASAAAPGVPSAEASATAIPPAGTPTPMTAIPPQATSAFAREIPTVFVVPRLFPSTGRQAGRLRPVVRRIAARLVEWADHAQGPREGSS
jgi:hypothetical protein